MIETILSQNPVDALDVAAALAALLQGEKSLFINEQTDARMADARERELRNESRSERPSRDRDSRGDSRERGPRSKALPEERPKPLKGHPEVEMTRYMVGIGYDDGLKPGNLVGAVATSTVITSAISKFLIISP